MQLSISEILKSVSEAGVHPLKVKKLKEVASNNMSVLAILKLAYDPGIKFLLPETDPPYKCTEAVGQEAMLYQNLRRMYLFIDCPESANLSQKKRELLFVQLIESLDPEDAKLLIAVKNKTIPYPGFTAKMVSQAFPDLLT